MNEKDIKQDIRKLRKLKKDLKSGSVERLTLHRQIKALQTKLDEIKGFDADKESLVKEIQKLDNDFETLGINLYKFTKEELEKHIQKLKEKKQ
jgi:uncharacterized coiled-coil DUF342 family protein